MPKKEHEHKFILESPEGEYSLGKCKCGKKKKFKNYFEFDINEFAEDQMSVVYLDRAFERKWNSYD